MLYDALIRCECMLILVLNACHPFFSKISKNTNAVTKNYIDGNFVANMDTYGRWEKILPVISHNDVFSYFMKRLVQDFIDDE